MDNRQFDVLLGKFKLLSNDNLVGSWYEDQYLSYQGLQRSVQIANNAAHHHNINGCVLSYDPRVYIDCGSNGRIMIDQITIVHDSDGTVFVWGTGCLTVSPQILTMLSGATFTLNGLVHTRHSRNYCAVVIDQILNWVCVSPNNILKRSFISIQ